MLAAQVDAQQPTAREVLEKLRASYGKITALHVVAEQEAAAHRRITSVECELAVKAGSRYFVRLKLADGAAISVSDGSNIWRALSARKQWAKVSAATLANPSDEDEATTGGSDLHQILERTMIGQFVALARIAEDPVIVKEVDFKLGHDKVRCYLIRTRAGAVEHELLVDKERFLPLQSKVKGRSADGEVENTLKVKSMELNNDVSDSLFSFEPGPGWKEVEALTLPGEQPMILTGGRAADFALKTLDGDPVVLTDLRGKVVVLDFWATWCPPCRAELPSIEKLRAEFGDAVQFYGINDESPATVKKFVERNHYAMPVLMDGKREVHRRYGIHAIPVMVVIGRDSVVRQQFLGTRSEGVLRKAIQSVVAARN